MNWPKNLAKKIKKFELFDRKGHSGKKPYEFIRRGTGGYGRR